jgi:hypothetical protein
LRPSIKYNTGLTKISTGNQFSKKDSQTLLTAVLTTFIIPQLLV